MRDEVRVANIFHKHGEEGSARVLRGILQAAAENNAKIASRFFNRPVGELKKGSYGDVVVMDYDPPTPITAAPSWATSCSACAAHGWIPPS